MNIRDTERDMYVYTERQKGRTYKDLSRELSISPERVRQVYERAYRDKRREEHTISRAQSAENIRRI